MLDLQNSGITLFVGLQTPSINPTHSDASLLDVKYPTTIPTLKVQQEAGSQSGVCQFLTDIWDPFVGLLPFVPELTPLPGVSLNFPGEAEQITTLKKR